MRRREATFSLLAGVLGSQVAKASTVPRPAPDFRFVSSTGQTIALSEHKGKVVVVELLFTTCPHCQRSAQTLTKLQQEYGPRGFQALGVAFNPMSHMLTGEFVKTYNVGFPVGSTSREEAQKLLQFESDARLSVPQVMYIDRKGQIRVQTPPESDEHLTQEAGMRATIENLLKERAPAASMTKATRKRSS